MRRTLFYGTLLATLFPARFAGAAPGTHGPPVSTWDTRASTLELGVRPGFLSGGHFFIASYYANFTATSGNLSSQFGVHYLNLKPAENLSILQGLSATAAGIYSGPIGERYENGVPRTAVGFYLGLAPSVLANGRASYISIPVVIGLGFPISPSQGVTIAPWFEASPGINLDTRINTATLTVNDIQGTVRGNQVTITEAQVNRILEKSVDFDTHFTAGLRAGLDLEFRLGDSAALDVSGMLGSLGGGFSGVFVGWVGAGLVIRWDSVVPAVLPAEQRLLREDCDDIEQRHRVCQAIKASGMAPAPVAPYAPPNAVPQYAAPQQWQPRPYAAPGYSPSSSAPTPAVHPLPGPPPPAPPSNSGSAVPTSAFPP